MTFTLVFPTFALNALMNAIAIGAALRGGYWLDEATPPTPREPSLEPREWVHLAPLVERPEPASSVRCGRPSIDRL